MHAKQMCRIAYSIDRRLVFKRKKCNMPVMFTATDFFSVATSCNHIIILPDKECNWKKMWYIPEIFNFIGQSLWVYVLSWETNTFFIRIVKIETTIIVTTSKIIFIQWPDTFIHFVWRRVRRLLLFSISQTLLIFKDILIIT